ncbi:MAG: Xaa-Pro peptidase family protein [Candidatus Neomarinimicrobiota bacterium]|nr:Xaa-Pro peptidase family protein [Candidatus Neomarinimicrobiota bacterium]
MNDSIYTKRQQDLRKVLDERGLDGMLITNLTNIRYISGFTGSAASCLITPEGQYFITDGRYIEQSKAQVKGFERFINMSSHLSQIKDNNLNPNGFKLAFEGDHMSYALYENMISVFPNTKWKSSSMILEDLASVKDDHELECIRTAVEVTDKVYEEILPMLRPGFTEKQVANTMVSKYREYAESEAYAPIVATGPNGALPHAIPTDREFENGDFIVIDAAAKYGGYHADMTRTPVIGEATDKHKEVYSIVKEAQQRGCDIAKAGVPCKEVDAATREYIGEMGYGEYYTHGTGHGLGLEIHTSPRFSPQSKQVLEVNNVMTIEPGIYLAGWGGVRIEDDVIIGKDDCEILNQTTKDLIILN